MMGGVEVIGVREAEEAYGVPRSTVSHWVALGLVRVQGNAGRGQRKMLVKRDVAACARYYEPGRGRHRFERMRQAVLGAPE